jgi:hypothetical protein
MGPQNDMILGGHLNKYGSHENQEFIRLSVNIMFDVRILMNFPKRLTDYEDEMKETAEKYRLEFRRLIKKYATDLWGFKEASLIYYLPYLADEIPNPLYIHLIRDYDSTANSLLDMVSTKNWLPEYHEKRKFFAFWKRMRMYLFFIGLMFRAPKYKNLEFFRKIVIDSHDRIRDFLKDKSHITIHTEELTENPEKIINEIINYLEITPSQNQITDALKFIHPELLTK